MRQGDPQELKNILQGIASDGEEEENDESNSDSDSDGKIKTNRPLIIQVEIKLREIYK